MSFQNITNKLLSYRTDGLAICSGYSAVLYMIGISKLGHSSTLFWAIEQCNHIFSVFPAVLQQFPLNSTQHNLNLSTIVCSSSDLLLVNRATPGQISYCLRNINRLKKTTTTTNLIKTSIGNEFVIVLQLEKCVAWNKSAIYGKKYV